MPEFSASGWKLDAIPILSDNYVWALSNGSNAIVVDPGEAKPVAAWLQAHDAELSSILITHHHPDHIGGLPQLKQRWPKAICYGPHDPRIADIDIRIGEGDSIQPHSALMAFDVMAVPGHTTTHIALHGEGILFCGDTLFSAGCGRLFEGTPAQMLASLDRLAALPGETRVCCGHEYTAANCRFACEIEPGNLDLRAYSTEVDALRARQAISLPSTVANERAVNPFLRIDAAHVRQTLERERALAPTADRVEAFAALRRWKDEYRG